MAEHPVIVDAEINFDVSIRRFRAPTVSKTEDIILGANPSLHILFDLCGGKSKR